MPLKIVCGLDFYSNGRKNESFYVSLWSDIEKVEFVCIDDPANAGKLEVGLYINGELYGKHSGRTDVFADGNDPKIYFHLQCKGTPEADDYCIVKSITYIPAE